MMVGRSVEQIFPAREPAPGAEVLRVAGYCHPTEFEDISFSLRRGEILGFYGLVGAGRSEVMQALFGITRPSAGRISVGGRSRAPPPRRGHRPRPGLRARGPRAQGAIAGLPIFQNVTLPSLGHTSRAGFLRLAYEFALARDYVAAGSARGSLDADVGRCRAATSRRWSSPSGWRPGRGSSSSTSRPRASTSAPRRRCTASWPSWRRWGWGSSWCRPRSRRSSACPTA